MNYFIAGSCPANKTHKEVVNICTLKKRLTQVGLNARKPDLHAKKNGAHQPAHLCSLISAFVKQYLESIMAELGTYIIAIF